MTSTQKGVVGGDLEVEYVFADIIVFKQKIYCSFFQMEGVRGSQFWSFFVDVIIHVTPKIVTILAISFFSNPIFHFLVD